jgi:phosphomannomutase
MTNKPHWLFDIDGTITDSRKHIKPEMLEVMLDFCHDNDVSFVTGSNVERTLQQIPEELFKAVNYCFCCSGNQVYKNGELLYEDSIEWPTEILSWSKAVLDTSHFSNRTGVHIDYRPGTMNFSVVGRGANEAQRLNYVLWDQLFQERTKIVQDFNNLFIDYEAAVGGETGIDICAKGFNKAQVIKWFPNTILNFFGDKTVGNGNDAPLAAVILDNKLGSVYEVDGWQKTRDLLSMIKK